MLDKLERKYGRYAIKDLTIKLMIVYVIGYIVCQFAQNYITFNPYLIFHGQIWRLFTWILVPLQDNILLYAISILLFYLPIGRMMERTWGDFKYNLYLLMGFLFTMIGSLLCYFGYYLYFLIFSGADASAVSYTMYIIGNAISAYTIPYYVTMSIFFAYAMTFPDAMVLFMFVIPVKMKWLGILYAALYLYELVMYVRYAMWPGVVVILASMLAIFIFMKLDKRGFRSGSFGHSSSNTRKKVYHERVQKAKSAAKMAAPGTPIHKCSVCGKTELDDPNLEFRYCSKCNGSYEYCQEHLFTHVHVK